MGQLFEELRKHGELVVIGTEAPVLESQSWNNKDRSVYAAFVARMTCVALPKAV